MPVFRSIGRRCHLSAGALVVLLASAGPTFGQNSASAGMRVGAERDPHVAAPAATAVRVGRRIDLDGRLDEAAWADAAPVSTFTQLDPNEGQPASEQTEARVLFDDEALYVGVRLRDRGAVTARLGRRDMEFGDSDWLGVIIDSYHDHRTAYSFYVNAAGVRRDEQRTNDFGDASWDAVWEAKTAVDGEGWTAELRIPFSQLRFNAANTTAWGIQLERRIGRRNERALFAFTPKAERGGVSRFGHLEGLSGVRPGKRLEILPYIVQKSEFIEPRFNPYRTKREASLSAGVDVKLRVSSEITLDATINPDFGQVEVDPAVVNLSEFETFFPERRPFFVEGASIFGFGSDAVGPGSEYAQVFYSRRIGRHPQIGPPSFRADVPTATSILGAAKLSGRTANGWSIGALEAVTQREMGRYRDAADVDRRTAVEPLSSYFVGRASREVRGGQGAFGAALTAVNRDLETPQLESSLRRAAYAGGLDFRQEWNRRSWLVSGFVTGSSVSGSREAIAATQQSAAHNFQRPDLEHSDVDATATSLRGYAAQLQVFKQAGEHWIGDAGIAAASPGYEINDLGFLSRSDILNANSRVVYRQNRPGAFLRSWQAYATTVVQTNYDGDWLTKDLQLGGTFRHLSYWGLDYGFGFNPETLNDRLTRGGPLTKTPVSGSGFAGIFSDSRQPISGNIYYNYDRDDAGSSRRNANARVVLRPSSRWNMEFGPDATRRHARAQFIGSVFDGLATATYGQRYLFAPLDLTEVSLVTRLNLTVSPTLSLQVFAQPFVSHGQFGLPSELRVPRTFTFDTYGVDKGTRIAETDGYRVDPDGTGPAVSFHVRDNDFSVRSLRGNAVLRWEWRPGSTLFVAWQQSRFDDELATDFQARRDTKDLFETRPDNVVVVKMSYWINR